MAGKHRSQRRLVELLCIAAFLSGGAVASEVAPGVYRTPEERFQGLEDFPYAPNYMEIQGLRVHYVDEGPRDAAPVLLIHGEPTWAYLFRKMIPVLTAAGHRVIAPDLIGFGRSDKLAAKEAYSYSLQVEVMRELVERLDLTDATFFGQDWGGLVGLRVVGALTDRFARVVVSNTGLPSASGFQGLISYPMFRLAVWWTGPLTLDALRENLTFPRWVAYSYHAEDLPIGEIMQFMGASEGVVRAYEAPFPDKRYKAGAEIMPYLVPSELTINETVWREVFEQWNKPFLVAFTDSDPITRGVERTFLERVPGAINVTIRGAGHFVQEDAGPELAALIVDFMAGREVAGFAVSAPSAENDDSP